MWREGEKLSGNADFFHARPFTSWYFRPSCSTAIFAHDRFEPGWAAHVMEQARDKPYYSPERRVRWRGAAHRRADSEPLI